MEEESTACRTVEMEWSTKSLERPQGGNPPCTIGSRKILAGAAEAHSGHNETRRDTGRSDEGSYRPMQAARMEGRQSILHLDRRPSGHGLDNKRVGTRGIQGCHRKRAKDEPRRVMSGRQRREATSATHRWPSSRQCVCGRNHAGRRHF